MKCAGILGAILVSAAQSASSAQFTAVADVGVAGKWGPNGNGTLKHEDDLQWLLFHNVRITADRAAGIYMASFDPLLLKMEGQSISITGYILPLEPIPASAHFVLTRRSPGCPYCPPNEPTEAIEIFSEGLVKATQAPITVQGKLHLVAHSDQGLFFRIDRARVW